MQRRRKCSSEPSFNTTAVRPENSHKLLELLELSAGAPVSHIHARGRRPWATGPSTTPVWRFGIPSAKGAGKSGFEYTVAGSSGFSKVLRRIRR